MIKWYENEENEVSSIRIMAMIAVILGAVICICGVVGFFMRYADSVLIVGSGSGLIALALGAKSWQAQSENKGV